METSLIFIILIVLTFIALVTYFVFLNKKNGDSPVPSPSSPQEESLLEKVIIKKQSEDTTITQSSFYKLSSTDVSPSPAFVVTTVTPSPSPIIVPSPAPSVFIEKMYTPLEIIALANDGNTTIEYQETDYRRIFNKYDSIFQNTINALFVLSGCEAQMKQKGSTPPLSKLPGLKLTTKLSNGQQISMPFILLLINTASKSQMMDNKEIKDMVTEFIITMEFIQSAERNTIIYNERTKQITFKNGRKPDYIDKYLTNKNNTISLDEFRDALRLSWISANAEIEQIIKANQYFDNYPICIVFTL